MGCIFKNKYRSLKIVSMTTLQVVLDRLHDKGSCPRICTRDHEIANARDAAVVIMDGTANGVGQLINLYYHPFYVSKVK